MARRPDLENRVLELLWDGEDYSVREVLDAIGGSLAYTTIATVLDRLHAKERVVRQKDGTVWRYRAVGSRDDAIAEEVSHVIRRSKAASEPLLVAFLDQVEAVDPVALDRLEALIRARKRGDD